MAKFFITLNRQITIKAQFDIEAASEDEAKDKALELALWDTPRDNCDNGIEWETDRTMWVKKTEPVVIEIMILE
jgi:hypothetical protein